MPKITQLMLAAGVAGAAAFAEVWNELEQQKAAVEQNQLYFYYGAKALLTEGKFAYQT